MSDDRGFDVDGPTLITDPFAWDDEETIVDKVIEMADRVRVANAVVPGAVAHWAFDMDGVRYRVTVQVDAA